MADKQMAQVRALLAGAGGNAPPDHISSSWRELIAIAGEGDVGANGGAAPAGPTGAAPIAARPPHQS